MILATLFSASASLSGLMLLVGGLLAYTSQRNIAFMPPQYAGADAAITRTLQWIGLVAGFLLVVGGIAMGIVVMNHPPPIVTGSS